jgi:ribosomal protein S3
MDAGARGVEIIVSGKVTSQRARTQIFRAGTMSKSGQPAQDGVDKGVAQCIQKSGTLGVIVKIMRANTKMGDDIKIKDDLLLKAQAEEESKLAKTRADSVIEEEEGVLSKDEKKLLDEVDEEDISEISLKPDKEDDEEKAEKK